MTGALLQPFLAILCGMVLLMIANKISIFGHASFKSAHDILVKKKKLVVVIAWACIIVNSIYGLFYILVPN